MSSSYDSSEEWDIQEEEEEMSMVWVMRARKRPKHVGSIVGRHKLWPERIEVHEKLMRGYFAENATFLENYFCRCFWMSINLFKKIVEELKKYDKFFEQWRNASGELGHSTKQKRYRSFAYVGIRDTS
jgi:hypothetical protein